MRRADPTEVRSEPARFLFGRTSVPDPVGSDQTIGRSLR